ncbi:glycoside hydrolase, partial [Jimgerdemannia flammicorona]
VVLLCCETTLSRIHFILNLTTSVSKYRNIETIESIFYFYRFTGKGVYREMGWHLFQSINKNCRARSGYSGLRDVTQFHKHHLEQNWDDTQESFFFAETLKYLYLLFSDDPKLLRLDQWVFNTEAHPLRIHPHRMGNKQV